MFMLVLQASKDSKIGFEIIFCLNNSYKKVSTNV